ncbi:MAG: histidine phosphatase family protein [Myxococcales bacterium]|nr:histidine phosphatase family protein [Myxococcales bacterium]
MRPKKNNCLSDGSPSMAFVVSASMALVTTFLTPTSLAADPSTNQLIVVVRHAEKPPAGLGQLTCQGLQRALRLPAWLARKFPTPDVIFAPDPSVRTTEIHGDGERYDYVRPLMTIEPTAIALGMPVNTQLPYYDSGLLADTLLAPDRRDQVIYVAWEHLQIMNFAQVLLTRFDSDAEVPEWSNADYDTVFAFHIDWAGDPSVRFEVKKQDLGDLPKTCPSP